MRKLCLCLILLSLLAFGGAASAAIGTIDDVPAATLLLPYFELDLNNQNGLNTLFSINNASELAVLAHVTFWTDQSVPALDFDVYLTGYDVQTISVRDILQNGNLPRTASAGQDSADTISPQGPVSQDINFASCSTLPYSPGEVSASFRAHLQAWFQGNQSPATGNCAGSKQPDTNVLRGYVTVDTVNACNLFFPSDWAFYAPFVTDQNVLWGDYIYIDSNQNLAQGETLVHIESCPTCFAPGDHTFYGRYNAASADDGREPLPTTMDPRYIRKLQGGPGSAAVSIFDAGTDFIVWREADDSDTAYSCALPGPPSWYPLESTQIVVFDEQEQASLVESCPSGDPTCGQEILIPNEAQRVDVTDDLLAPFEFGWIYLNLQHPEVIPIYGDTAAQMWVSVVMQAEGRYSVGFDGIQLDNANNPITTLIPVP